MDVKTMRLSDFFIVGSILRARVVRNTKCFGWHLYDKTHNSETTTWLDSVDAEHMYGNEWRITPNYKSETKFFVDLTFCRDESWFKNLSSIRVLETIYNILFFIRKAIGALLIPFFVLLIVTSSVFNKDDLSAYDGILFYLPYLIWGVLVAVETILASVARVILIPEDGEEAAFRLNYNGRVTYAHGFGNDISLVRKIVVSIKSVVYTLIGFLLGGSLGEALSKSLINNGATLIECSPIIQIIIAFVICAITIFLLVMTMIKTWKPKRIRLLFIFLDLLVPSVLMFLFLAFFI